MVLPLVAVLDRMELVRDPSLRFALRPNPLPALVLAIEQTGMDDRVDRPLQCQASSDIPLDEIGLSIGVAH